MAVSSTDGRRFETGKDRGPEGQAALTWFSCDYKECGRFSKMTRTQRSPACVCWLLAKAVSAQGEGAVAREDERVSGHQNGPVRGHEIVTESPPALSPSSGEEVPRDAVSSLNARAVRSGRFSQIPALVGREIVVDLKVGQT